MKVFAAISLFLALATASPAPTSPPLMLRGVDLINKRKDGCNANNCARAVTALATRSPISPLARRMYVSSTFAASEVR